MKYRVRPGLVLVTVCGVALLVPTRSASEQFPEVVPLSFLQIAIWEGMSKPLPMEKLYLAFQMLLKKPEDETRAFVDAQLDTLYQKGVLIPNDACAASPSPSDGEEGPSPAGA